MYQIKQVHYSVSLWNDKRKILYFYWINIFHGHNNKEAFYENILFCDPYDSTQFFNKEMYRDTWYIYFCLGWCK